MYIFQVGCKDVGFNCNQHCWCHQAALISINQHLSASVNIDHHQSTPICIQFNKTKLEKKYGLNSFESFQFKRTQFGFLSLEYYLNTFNLNEHIFFIFWVIFDPCLHDSCFGFLFWKNPQTFARFACLWKTLSLLAP